MIQRKGGEFSLPQKAYRRVICCYLSYGKPRGKLALGQNCIKVISDKSNSMAMFLRFRSDIEMKCHVTATFWLKCTGK